MALEEIGPPGAKPSSRITDANGWFQVPSNPLSKVGVFPYSGASIGAPEPGRIYNVYRPEEELSNIETLESFKLLPWIDEHKMLGSEEDGLTPAEQKGVHGIIGEEIYFQDGVLYGNVKVFSDSLAQLIKAGKRELSAGYRCVYEFASGIWNGIRYDAIQRKIRGNHIALVQEGRMGPDVAVLDHLTFTFDARELKIMAEKNPNAKDDGEEKKSMTLEEATAMLQELVPAVTALQEAMSGKGSSEGTMDKATKDEKEKEEKEKEAADKAAKDAAMCKDEDDKDKKDDKKDGKGEDKAIAAMDAKITNLQNELAEVRKGGIRAVLTEVAARDKLAADLSHHIGTFDHAEKTLDEVAAYGVEKLGIKVIKGQEHAALQGYLHGRTSGASTPSFALDSAATRSSQIDDYLKPQTQTQH